MQQYVTKEMLADLGLDVSDDQLAHLNETVEERIGVEITESLNDDQLKELLALEESGSEDELGNWIAEHIPEYQEIIEDNIDIVIGEFVDENDNSAKK